MTPHQEQLIQEHIGNRKVLEDTGVQAFLQPGILRINILGLLTKTDSIVKSCFISLFKNIFHLLRPSRMSATIIVFPH